MKMVILSQVSAMQAIVCSALNNRNKGRVLMSETLILDNSKPKTNGEPSLLEQKCAAAGLKITEQRRVILRILEDAEDHPSAELVYDRTKEIDPSISIATVYRTLNLLDQLQLIQKHDFKESFSRFESNMEHHHHLIDIDSGQVI